MDSGLRVGIVDLTMIHSEDEVSGARSREEFGGRGSVEEGGGRDVSHADTVLHAISLWSQNWN